MKKLQQKQNSKKANFINKKLLPTILNLPNTTHLVVMRDGLALLLPLTIVGSIGTLAVTFIFGGWGGTSTSVLGWIANAFGGVTKSEGGNWTFIVGSGWEKASNIGIAIFGPLKSYTLDSFALYASFMMGYMVGKARKVEEPGYAGIMGLACFLVVTRTDKFYFDGTGVFLAMFISMIAAEALCCMINSGKFKFKLPSAVPVSIVRGFDVIAPVLIVLISIGTLDAMSWLLSSTYDINVMTTQATVIEGTNKVSLEQVVKFEAGSYGFGGLFIQFISGPMLNIVAGGNVGLGIAIFYTLGIGIFWIMGIHGSNMMNIVFWPIFVALVQVNLNLKTMGIPNNDPGYAIWTGATFDGFIIVTGGGITGALVLGILLFGSKFIQEKEIAKMAAVPQMFNINEPVTFGFPIVFSFKWGLPFILTMPTACVITYLALTLHLVHPTFVLVPWTLPLGLGGLLATGMDPLGFLLAWTNFGVAFLIYFPFIIMANRSAIKKLKKDGIYESEKLRIYKEGIENKKLKFERKIQRLEAQKNG